MVVAVVVVVVLVVVSVDSEAIVVNFIRTWEAECCLLEAAGNVESTVETAIKKTVTSNILQRERERERMRAHHTRRYDCLLHKIYVERYSEELF